MALITNIWTTPITIVDGLGKSHDLAIGGTLTIDDLILPYSSVDDGITNGWITVTNYTIPGSGGGGGGGGGDASAANQTVGNASLATIVTSNAAISTNTATIGTNTGSLVTSNAAINTNTATIGTNTGSLVTSNAAINTNTGSLVTSNSAINTSTAAINTKTPALGVAAAASSVPVTLATNDAQIGAKTTGSTLNAGGSGIVGWLSDGVTQLKTLSANSQPLQNTLPKETSNFSVVSNAPQKTFRCGFESAVASGLDSAFFTPIIAGAGMTVSQSAGSANLVSGTTAYSETIYRSVNSFSASMTLRYSTQLSQRIANQEFYVELVDLIGDLLSYTINSATSVTVTIPGNTFTAANVGQSVYIGALTVASCPSGRYAIASVSGNNVTFTVAGFPATGTGTCSLFGWNYQHVIYNGTTPTLASYDAGRNGYSSGETFPTINTTVAPGHVGILSVRDATAGFSDQLSASSTVLETTLRASRVRNVPEDLTNLFIQLRVVNLATAPASTTTWNVGFIEIENFVAQQVSLVSVSPQSLNAALPVLVANTPNIGTVTTVSTLAGTTTLTPGTGAANLGKAEDAVSASGDTGVFILGVRRDALVVSASATGDYNEFAINQYGASLTQLMEKSARTYSASMNVAAASAATDIAVITGSASATVFITRVIISGIQTTAGLNEVFLIKRSTANTGGTAVATTPLPHDSADAASSATVASYTANPTTGTPVGTLRRNYQPIGGATSIVNPIIVYDFGDKGRPLTLRGIAQQLAVNLNGATLAGGTFDVAFEWYEI